MLAHLPGREAVAHLIGPVSAARKGGGRPLNEQGYYLGRVERNLFCVTD